jgi:hypothetical protein
MAQERKLLHEEVIKPGNAFGGVLKKGQYLRVIDLEGKQAGDLVFFNEHNIKECNCHGVTRSRQFKSKGAEAKYKIVSRVTEGNVIFSTLYNPMATITADTPPQKGVHDMFFHMCNNDMFKLLGFPERQGCWEAECRALAKYGIAPEQIPDPLNIFMNTELKGEQILIHEPVTRPGDYIEVRAEMDVIFGLACCPHDIGAPVNAYNPTPLKIQIYDKD